jgi:hypothetical protein
MTIWPAASKPDPANAEIVRVTVVSTDTLTITRAQESTSARTVIVGDQVAATITAKTLTDIEGQAPHTQLVGDGAATTFDISHNLGTRDVFTTVRRNSTPWDEVYPEVQSQSTDIIRLVFGNIPTSDQFVVTVTTGGVAVGVGSRYSATVGDGASTTIDKTHGLGTRDVSVTVARNTDPWDEVYPEVQRLSTSAVRLIFLTAPATDEFRVTVIG